MLLPVVVIVRPASQVEVERGVRLLPTPRLEMRSGGRKAPGSSLVSSADEPDTRGFVPALTTAHLHHPRGVTNSRRARPTKSRQLFMCPFLCHPIQRTQT